MTAAQFQDNTEAAQTERLSAALTYAVAGYSPIPLCGPDHDCESPGKSPHIRQWVQLHGQAAPPAAAVQRLFTGHGANIGLALLRHQIVLDVDPRAGGAESLELLLAEHGPLPLTPHAETGGRGDHFYFTLPPGDDVAGQVGAGGSLATVGYPGVEWKAYGGQVVAPPSRHASGGVYQWYMDEGMEEVPVAEVPAWLLELILAARRTHRPARPLPEHVGEGQRNATLTSLAGAMRRRGASKTAIAAALGAENLTVCDPPLGVREVETIAASVARYAPQKGRNGASATDGVDLLSQPFTDLGNAERLISLYGQDIRFCFARSRWLVWDGSRWADDNKGALMAMAGLTVRAVYDAAGRLAQSTAAMPDAEARATAADVAAAALGWARRSESRSRLEAMTVLARALPGVPVQPDELDSDGYLLNVQNGTVDLRTGQLRSHRREDLCTKITSATYEPGAERDDTWTTFLEAAVPDPDMRTFMQKAAGRSTIGEASADLILLLHGPGGSGKSTFLEAIRGALGDYAKSAMLETFSGRRDPNGPMPDLARLAGARLVTVPEAAEGGGLVGLLKAVTRADAITTRSHHQESFEFRPTFVIWLRANSRSKMPADDTGLWRRLRELPFNEVFARPDPKIRAQLTRPGPAQDTVLTWLIEGALRFQQEGLGETPDAVLSATSDYRAEMDPISDWLEDHVVAVANSFTPGSVLFEDYARWAQDQGIRRPLGRKGFSQRLEAAGYLAEKGGGGTRGHRGIGLRTPGDAATPAFDPSSRYGVALRKCHSISDVQVAP